MLSPLGKMMWQAGKPRDVAQRSELIFEYCDVNGNGPVSFTEGSPCILRWLQRGQPRSHSRSQILQRDASIAFQLPWRCNRMPIQPALIPQRLWRRHPLSVGILLQLESTTRSFRALSLQLMRRVVPPESRADAVRGVICMTYMVCGSS